MYGTCTMCVGITSHLLKKKTAFPIMSQWSRWLATLWFDTFHQISYFLKMFFEGSDASGCITATFSNEMSTSEMTPSLTEQAEEERDINWYSIWTTDDFLIVVHRNGCCLGNQIITIRLFKIAERKQTTAQSFTRKNYQIFSPIRDLWQGQGQRRWSERWRRWVGLRDWGIEIEIVGREMACVNDMVMDLNI